MVGAVGTQRGSNRWKLPKKKRKKRMGGKGEGGEGEKLASRPFWAVRAHHVGMLNLKPFCGYPDDGFKVDTVAAF